MENFTNIGMAEWNCMFNFIYFLLVLFSGLSGLRVSSFGKDKDTKPQLSHGDRVRI